MTTPLVFVAAAAGTLTAQIAVVVIAFFVVMWILTKFAWGPIIRLIDERRETISREFRNIEDKQGHLESQIKDYEERLRNIQAEAREMMNAEIEKGKKSAAEIVEESRVQAEELKAKAASDIQLEVEKARAELRDEIVRLTIGATERLLKAELNDDRRRELVGSFISEIESRNN